MQNHVPAILKTGAHVSLPGPLQDQGSTEHGRTQQDSTVLPRRWAGHWSLADKKQSCCSHSFYQHALILIFGRKTQPGTPSSPRLLPETKDVTMESPRRANPYEPAGLPREKEHRQGFFLSCPPEAALPLISQAWRRCSLLLHRGGRISVLLLPLISVPDSLCSPLQRCSPLLFSCQELCHKVLYKRARLREGFSLGMISLILFPTSFYCLWGYDPLEPACIATWKHWLDKQQMFSNTRMKEPRSRNTPSRYQIPSTEISRVSNSEDDSKSVSLHNHHFSVTNLIIPVEGHMPKNTVRVGQGEIKTNNSSWSPLKSRQQSSHAFKVTYKWLQPTKQSKARKPQWSSQQETWPLTSNTSNLVIMASQSTSNFPPDWIY